LRLDSLLDSADQLMHFLKRFGAEVLKHSVDQIKGKGDSFLLVHTNSIFATAEMGQRRDPVQLCRRSGPRQRRLDDRWVDLVVDLRLNACLSCGLVHTVGPAPPQDLLLGQVGVGSELPLCWHWERAGAVHGSRVVHSVGCLSAVTAPTSGQYDLGWSCGCRSGVHPLNNPSCSCGHDESFRGLKICCCKASAEELN
jgi:hypothetical protein